MAKVHPTNVRLGPHTSVAQSIEVDQLGVQVVGVSASTLVSAVYKTADGIARAAALPAVWIEHELDFSAARVRSAMAEARSNGALSFAALRSRRPSAARALDTASGRINQISVPNDESLTGTQLVAQPSWLPDPAQLRAMNPPNPQQETDGISDAERASASADANTGAFDKGGNYKICSKVPYWYIDSNMGEDYLTGQTSTTEGYEPARYWYGVIFDSPGNSIWAGSLSSEGCTPYINLANGTYLAAGISYLYRGASNVTIEVTQDDSGSYVWGYQFFTISGSGGTKTLTFTGFWGVSDAAIAAANTIYRSTSAYPDGTHLNIYTD